MVARQSTSIFAGLNLLTCCISGTFLLYPGCPYIKKGVTFAGATARSWSSTRSAFVWKKQWNNDVSEALSAQGKIRCKILSQNNVSLSWLLLFSLLSYRWPHNNSHNQGCSVKRSVGTHQKKLAILNSTLTSIFKSVFNEVFTFFTLQTKTWNKCWNVFPRVPVPPHTCSQVT